MAAALTFVCAQHATPFDCPDALLLRRKDGAIGLIIHDGGSATIDIQFCPWCGSKLTGTHEMTGRMEREALIALVHRIRTVPEEAEDLLEVFKRHVTHPSPSDLIFHPKRGQPSPSDAEIVDEALASKPVLL